MAGDMLTAFDNAEKCKVAAELMKELAADYPVYYGMGNHEHRIGLCQGEFREIYDAYIEKLYQFGIEQSLIMQIGQKYKCIFSGDLLRLYIIGYRHKTMAVVIHDQKKKEYDAHHNSQYNRNHPRSPYSIRHSDIQSNL